MSSTLTYEAMGPGFRATNEGVDAQGNPTKGIFGVYFYDGKSYPVTGVPAYDTSSYKLINDTTAEMPHKGRKSDPDCDPRACGGRQTLTFTTTGLNANGQQINDFAVYEKQ